MSTRANIAVEGTEIKIYKHSDGYPKYMIPRLIKIADKFLENRGDDPHYLPAYILREFKIIEEEESKDWYRAYPDPIKSKERNDCLGWGIQTYFSEDIDFMYKVNLTEDNHFINVYRIYGDFNDDILSRFKVIETIDLGMKEYDYKLD